MRERDESYEGGERVDDKERWRWRLANLQVPWVDEEFLKETHKISWPPDDQFAADFETWLSSRGQSERREDGKIHRYAFEAFLQSQKLLTRADASASLGMRPESLDELLPQLPRLGLSKKYKVYPGIIDSSLSDDLISSLKNLRFKTFHDHDSFCRLLHGAIHEALGLTIKELFCATADELGGQRMYASTWDNITLKPLSMRHGVWLDFKKPLSLTPDRCSKLFLARHYEELKDHLAGREAPRDLRFYLDFNRRSA